MEIRNEKIDGGRAFDWGRTSEDYARYRDIYPPAFYEEITRRGLCVKGQRVLDLGTGTGVIPRNLYSRGAVWTGSDIAEKQIVQAKRMAAEAGMDITFLTAAAEDLSFPDGSFDVVTACQCFWYFDHARLAPMLWHILTPGGRLVLLYMAWLPYEDAIAGKSEDIVLHYNPGWTGAGETRHPIWIPEAMNPYFTLTDHKEYDLPVHFTRESWHGRMKACRGVGASLDSDALARWERDHRAMLEEAPAEFDVLHYAAIAVLERKEQPDAI